MLAISLCEWTLIKKAEPVVYTGISFSHKPILSTIPINLNESFNHLYLGHREYHVMPIGYTGQTLFVIAHLVRESSS